MLESPLRRALKGHMPELVFVSYAREGSKYVVELSRMIDPLVKKGVLEFWVDHNQIRAGDRWANEIDRALNSARVAVLFVSTDFLASEFIEGTEFPRLREAIETRGLRLLWILVSACLYETWGLGATQAAHDINFPLAKLKSARKKEVLREIALEIQQTITSSRAERPPPPPPPIALLPEMVVPLAAAADDHSPGSPEKEVLIATLTSIIEGLQKRITDLHVFLLPLLLCAGLLALVAIGAAAWQQTASFALYGLGGAALLVALGLFARAQRDLAKQQIVQARFFHASLAAAGKYHGDIFPPARNFIQQYLGVTLP